MLKLKRIVWDDGRQSGDPEDYSVIDDRLVPYAGRFDGFQRVPASVPRHASCASTTGHLEL
jgi:hypothetical protein